MFSSTDITNGGSQITVDEHSNKINLSTMAPITRITAVTSKATNYEIPSDDTSNSSLTQATIISEPYFDAQTPKNVTGLVGELLVGVSERERERKIDKKDNFPIFSSQSLSMMMSKPLENNFQDNSTTFSSHSRKIFLFELPRTKFRKQNRIMDSSSGHSYLDRWELYIHK